MPCDNEYICYNEVFYYPVFFVRVRFLVKTGRLIDIHVYIHKVFNNSVDRFMATAYAREQYPFMTKKTPQKTHTKL